MPLAFVVLMFSGCATGPKPAHKAFGWQQFCDAWGHSISSFQMPLTVDLKSAPPEIVIQLNPTLVNRDNGKLSLPTVSGTFSK